MNNNKTKMIIIGSVVVGVLLVIFIIGIFLIRPNGALSNKILEGTYTHESKVDVFGMTSFSVVTSAIFQDNTITITVYDPLLNKASLSRTGSYKIKGSEIIVTWKDSPNIGNLTFSFSWFVGDEWRVSFQRAKDMVLLDGDEYVKNKINE